MPATPKSRTDVLPRCADLINAVNARQIHAGHSLQLRLQIELRFITGRLAVLLPSSLLGLLALDHLGP